MLKNLRDSFFISLLVFLILLGLFNLNLNFEFLNPVENVFDDLDMTDIVFSQIKPQQDADDRIVVVNIGYLDRLGLAEMVDSLNKYQPKVIGIDAEFIRPTSPCKFAQEYGIFDCKQNPGAIPDSIWTEMQMRANMVDEQFAASLSKVKSLVLASKGLYNPKKQKIDSIRPPYKLLDVGHTGFVNLITDGVANMASYATARSFMPQLKVDKHTEYSFSVKIAELYNKKTVKKLLARKNEEEFINFKGNINYNMLDTSNIRAATFPVLDWKQALGGSTEFTADLIKDKIVLLGFTGANLNKPSYEDIFYTPLNKKYVGKSTPDMYGVVVHANTISMILDKEYIDVASTFVNILISFLVCYISVIIFSYLYKKSGVWYDGLVLITQLLILLLILVSTVGIFTLFHLKIDLNVAFFAVIIAGFMVEIYYGILHKIFQSIKNKTAKIDKEDKSKFDNSATNKE